MLLHDTPTLLHDLKHMRKGAERKIAMDDVYVGYVRRKSASEWVLWQIGSVDTHFLTVVEAAEYIRYFFVHGVFPSESPQSRSM